MNIKMMPNIPVQSVFLALPALLGRMASWEHLDRRVKEEILVRWEGVEKRVTKEMLVTQEDMEDEVKKETAVQTLLVLLVPMVFPWLAVAGTNTSTPTNQNISEQTKPLHQT